MAIDLSLAGPNDPKPQLTVNPFESKPATVSGESLEDRAGRWHFAYGEGSPGYEALKQSISAGLEDNYRRQLAISQDLEFQKTKRGVIEEMAKNSGGQVSNEDAETIMGLTQAQLGGINGLTEMGDRIGALASTVFERSYAKRLINTFATMAEDSPILRALQEDPDTAHQQLDLTEDFITKKQSMLTVYEDIKAREANMGWGSWSWDMAETFVPFKSSVNLSDAAVATSTILPGDNLSEQVQYIWSLSPEQAKETFKRAVEEIASRNTLDAVEFAEAVMAYSDSDEFLDNIFGGLDVLDVATLGIVGKGARGAKGLAKAGAKAVARDGVVGASVEATVASRNALRDLVKAGRGLKTNIGKALSETGHITEAARVFTLERAKAALRGTDPQGRLRDMKEAAYTLTNPSRIFNGVVDLAAGAKMRLERDLTIQGLRLQQIVNNPQSLRRLTDEALVKAIKEAEESFKKRYKKLEDTILDIVPNTGRKDLFSNDSGEKGLDNTYSISVYMGTPNGNTFVSPNHAVNTATDIYGLPEGGYRVQQVGNGYVLKMDKDIDESTGSVREQLAQSLENKTPMSLANTFLGVLRSPEDTLSEMQKANRHLATHGVSKIHKIMAEAAQSIGKLKSKQLKQLDQILTANRDYEHITPDGKKIEGRWHETVSSLNEAYMDSFNRLPTEKEIKAYYTYVQLNDIDFMMRNLDLRRDKSIQGIESAKIYLPATDGTMRPTNAFDVKVHDDPSAWDALLENDKEAGIYVFNAESGKAGFRNKNSTTREFRDYVRKLINEDGYKLVQIANPTHKPLEQYTGISEAVNFMVVRDIEVRQLPLQQIPYRAGPHKVHTNEWYIKQAIIDKVEKTLPDEMEKQLANVYGGDTTVLGFNSEKQAREWAAKMDQARVLLKEGGDWRGFVDANLPYTADDFESLFKPRHTPDGKELKPILSLDEEILATKQGNNLGESYDLKSKYQNFEDTINSEYNLYKNIDKKFAGQRDPNVNTVIRDGGSEENPVFKFQRGSMMNPLETLNSAASNIARSKYFDDYKIGAVTSFVEEFGDVLRSGDLTGPAAVAELRKDPVLALHEPSWNYKGDPARIAAAKNARRAALNLLGTQSDLNRNWSWVKAKMLDSVYTHFGDKATNFVHDHMLPSVTDPFSYARNMAFHLKLGLFNPVQLFLQAQTLVHVMGVAGAKNGSRGLAAGVIARMASLTEKPEVLEHLAGIASSFGWKKEHWLESLYEMRKAGIDVVGGEYGSLDTLLDPGLYSGKIKGTANRWLDKGTFFFKQGEHLVRQSAWNTAYLEWRTANPNRAAAGTLKAPPLQKGYVRLYRGEGGKLMNSVKGGGWYTTDINKARKYGDLVYIDVKDDASEWKHWVQGHNGKDERMTNSPEMLQRAKPYQEVVGSGLTDKDRAWIMNRYQTLTVNMTRASNAAWQQGFMSVPTQFFGYAARLSEQFLGNRLTKTEKVRALLTYSAMYGVPTAASAVIPWPFYEDVKQAALERGIQVNDGAMAALMEGLPSLAIQTFLGSEVNFAQRYGPGGLSVVKEAIEDKNIAELMFGASGSILGSAIGAVQPLAKGLMNVFSPEDSDYPLLVEDFIDASREISTVNNAAKMIYAINTGKYITRNEIYLGDVTTWDAVFMGITGLTPRDVSDAFIKIESMQELKDAQDAAKKQAIKYLRKAFTADSPEEMNALLKAARTHIIGGGFTPDQQSDIFMEATKGNTSLVDKINEDFLTKAPMDQITDRMNANGAKP